MNKHRVKVGIMVLVSALAITIFSLVLQTAHIRGWPFDYHSYLSQRYCRPGVFYLSYPYSDSSCPLRVVTTINVDRAAADVAFWLVVSTAVAATAVTCSRRRRR